MQAAIADLKKAIESNDVDTIKTASEKAATVSQKMGTAIYQAAQAAQAAEGGASGSDSAAAPNPRLTTTMSWTPRSWMRARAEPPDDST